MVSRRSFHREFKLALCEEIVQGRKSKAQACREHALSPGMLDRWVDQYRQLGEDAFPNSTGVEPIGSEHRIRELEALVGRLTLENEFLKAAAKKGLELREKRRK